MPKAKSKTIYCLSPARDGKGGVYKVGQKIADLEESTAAHLLSSKRFTEDEKEAKEAAAKLAKAEKESKAEAK